MRLFIPLLLIALHFCGSVLAGDDAFYIWQQVWSPAVQSAVKAEPPTSLYPLASVVAAKGKSSLVAIPWPELSGSPHHYTPVIRIPLSAFKRPDIQQELERVIRAVQQSMKPRPLKRIQLDLDCPERLLPRYTELLSLFRQRFSTLDISITALPVHLKHREFKTLIRHCNSYVLQVHGLEVPKQLTDHAELLNLKTAEQALKRAEYIAHPYFIALPTYAYELNFDPASGAFRFLTAEKPNRRGPTLKKRIAARPADLLKLLKQCESLKHAQGIIWFRLPVEGDRLCWPRDVIAQLQHGQHPSIATDCRTIRLNPTTLELELQNTGIISAHQVELNLSWPQKTGTFDLYQGTTAEARPGQLPDRLITELPAPGQSIRLGWFQSNANPTITVSPK